VRRYAVDGIHYYDDDFPEDIARELLKRSLELLRVAREWPPHDVLMSRSFHEVLDTARAYESYLEKVVRDS
jgi:hypothetical protein